MFDLDESEDIRKCFLDGFKKFHLHKESFDVLASFELSEEQREQLEKKTID